LKKPFLILVILLLVSIIGMVTITQSGDSSTRVFVNPSSIIDPTLQPQTARTVRPNADGTFRDWTDSTVVLRPNSEGTYSDWTGRTLTLNPNSEGTYRQWSAWTHLQPRTDVEQNYTGWAGASGDWDDWSDHDGDSSVVSASSASYNSENETSALTRPPTERRSLNIQKVRVNIVARYYVTTGTSDEQVQMMLCTVLNANVSSFTVASGWNGWTRTGSDPWLNKEDYPSNYIYSSVTGDRIGNFTFYDIPAGITWNPEPGGVAVRLKAWQTGDVGDDDNLKIHLFDGAVWKTFTPPIPLKTPDPSYADYSDVDVSSLLNTRDKINNAKMAIEKVTVGTPDTIYIDYACIRLTGVTTPSSYGGTTGLTPSYRTYHSDWSTNPLTGSAWTWSDIDALQAGVRAIQAGSTWSGVLRVTQLYVGILTGQGLYTDWDEYPDPTGPNGGDEDLFSATADALRQSSALPNVTTPPFPTISKVRVTAVASNPDTLDVLGREVVTGWDGWTRIPTGLSGSPWLDVADYNVNYIATSTQYARIGNFTFQNVPQGSTWDTVTLRLRAWRSSSVPTLTVYLYNGESWQTTTIIDLSTISGSYYDIGVSGFLNSEARINATKMALEKGGSTGTVYVDYACLSLADREKIQLMVAVPPFDYKANATQTGTLPPAWRDWTEVPSGTSGTWLNAPDYPSNHIYTSAAGEEGLFPFADVPSGTTWSTVKLYLKTWQTGADGSDSISIDVTYDGHSTWNTYAVTPTFTAAPGDYKYVDVSSYLDTETKINNAQILLTKVTSGTADTIGVDHAYLYLSGVAYCGAVTALTTTYTEYTSEWSTSPATGLAWTWSDINKTEVGVRSKVSGLWTGEIRVTQLYVKVIEAGSYTLWDEPLPDHNSDADYNSAISGGLSRSSGLENQPAGATWTPARVQVTIVAKTDISTDEKVKIMLVVGATTYLGSAEPLSTSYKTYTYLSPVALTWSDINSMEAGVQSVQTGIVWKGEIRVTQLYVIVGRDGTYENWDEASANGDADYFSATMTAMKESSRLEDPTDPGWTIGRVRVVIFARTNITTDEQVQLMLVIAGEAYLGTTYNLTTAYTSYTADWGKNPKYNIPWNWTALTDLEAGLTSVEAGTEWKGEIRVTQLYVEIAGPRFTVDVKVENVVDVLGYSIQLKYNTAVTTATAIIFNDTSFFTTQWILQEEVNDAAGYVWFASQSLTGLKSGSGTLATIIFLVDSTGETLLDLCVLEFFTNGSVEIYWIVGDVERDRTIDISDLSILSNDYGSSFGDPNWNLGRCNFNGDNKVDVSDLFDQSKNYGKTYAYDGYFNNTIP